jgi:hypothetical protein
MREKTKLMIKKVYSLLMENEYMTTEEIAQKCHIKHWAVHAIIRQLRIDNIGVLTTYKGYILAEYGKQTDDVTFIRRIMGRRTSDIIAVRAAEKHIKKRWKTIEGKNNINNVLSYLSPVRSNDEQAKESIKYLLTYVNSKGS